MDDLKSDYNFNNIDYVHFSEVNECDEFIKDLQKLNYSVKQRCCGGRGVGVSKCDYDEVLKLSFEKINRLKIEKINNESNSNDICCVCFNNTTYRTICKHFLCNNCNVKLVKRICPYCRHDL